MATAKPKKSTTQPAKRAMTESHKAAIAAGRSETKAVDAYLEALRAHKPRRGRRRTVESIDSRLNSIAHQIPEVGAVAALRLIQERVDLTREREALANAVGPEQFVDGFVVHAAAFATRHGIEAAAWREFGVPAAILKQAGIAR